MLYLSILQGVSLSFLLPNFPIFQNPKRNYAQLLPPPTNCSIQNCGYFRRCKFWTQPFQGLASSRTTQLQNGKTEMHNFKAGQMHNFTTCPNGQLHHFTTSQLHTFNTTKQLPIFCQIAHPYKCKNSHVHNFLPSELKSFTTAKITKLNKCTYMHLCTTAKLYNWTTLQLQICITSHTATQLNNYTTSQLYSLPAWTTS